MKKAPRLPVRPFNLLPADFDQRSFHERRAPPASPVRGPLLKLPSLRGAEPGLLNVRWPGVAALVRLSPGFQPLGFGRDAEAVRFGSKPSITSTGINCLVKRSIRLTFTPSA